MCWPIGNDAEDSDKRKGECFMTFHSLLVNTRESEEITVYTEYEGIIFSATMTAGEWRAQKTTKLLLSTVEEISAGINNIRVTLERK
jgi:hypothetical protein